jgi:hypothetical protein
MTIEKEVKDASMGRAHVVILGAGASRAAAPKGDRNGKRLPVMDDFIETLELEPLLRACPIYNPDVNFEALYSDICEQAEYGPLKAKLEARVRDYFSELRLPDSPTIYDYLVLSLRSKDVIATFNWDPFLWQAYARNHSFTKMPHVLFLHGNVGFGWCEPCRVIGHKIAKCPKCGKPYGATPLLFPVKQKDYTSNDFIKTAWELLQMCLEHAYILTIFGYGAPTTDVEAIRLMREAWGPPATRNFEQIEIVDLKNAEILESTWKDFIHSHHYQVKSDFHESWIARHPRRTCEAMWNQTQECAFLDSNPPPRSANLRELHSWYGQFLPHEKEDA